MKHLVFALILLFGSFATARTLKLEAGIAVISSSTTQSSSDQVHNGTTTASSASPLIEFAYQCPINEIFFLQPSARILNGPEVVTPVLEVNLGSNLNDGLSLFAGINASTPFVTTSVVTDRAKTMGNGFQIGAEYALRESVSINVKLQQTNQTGQGCVGPACVQIADYKFQQNTVSVGLSFGF